MRRGMQVVHQELSVILVDYLSHIRPRGILMEYIYLGRFSAEKHYILTLVRSIEHRINARTMKWPPIPESMMLRMDLTSIYGCFFGSE